MGEKKIVRVVIDANVVVSALLFGGTPGKLLAMWQSGRLLPYISPPILEEYLQVLAYPRFELAEKEIDFLVYRKLLPYFEVVEAGNAPPIFKNDSSDDKFLHCAFAGGVDAIVSGDHHLLNLKKYKGIPILSPSRLLARFKD